MTDKLIEAVARAIDGAKWYDTCRPTEYDLARTAIAAIEASGTHRVVPVQVLGEARAALYGARELLGKIANIQHAIDLLDAAMLAAAPKVLDE